jgi:hypothetical protein
MIQPKDEILTLPLQERVDLAIRETYRKVLEERRRAGVPLAILRDGQVVEVPAEELLAQEAEIPNVHNESSNGR